MVSRLHFYAPVRVGHHEALAHGHHLRWRCAGRLCCANTPQKITQQTLLLVKLTRYVMYICNLFLTRTLIDKVATAAVHTYGTFFLCAKLRLVLSLQPPHNPWLRPHLCICRVRLRGAVADAPVAVHEHVPGKKHNDKHAEPEEHEGEVLCRLRAERLCEPSIGKRQVSLPELTRTLSPE